MFYPSCPRPDAKRCEAASSTSYGISHSSGSLKEARAEGNGMEVSGGGGGTLGGLCLGSAGASAGFVASEAVGGTDSLADPAAELALPLLESIL